MTSVESSLQSYRASRVVVTGASGFVGSHLTRLLVNAGAHVTTLGRSPFPARLADLSERCTHSLCDMTDRARVAEVCSNVRPNFVFHLAAYAVQARHRDFRIALATNVNAALNLIEAASTAGVRGIVQVGTSHEYGAGGPLSEDSALNPVGMYGASKAAGMILGRARARELGAHWLGVRPFVVYGPDEDEQKLIPHIVLNALRGERVITTTGEQVRDLIYVQDLVEAVACALVASPPAGEVLNVASGSGVPLARVFDILHGLLPRAVWERGARNLRPDDVQVQFASVQKLQHLLPWWRPRVGLEQGLGLVVEHYRRRVAAPAAGDMPA